MNETADLGVLPRVHRTLDGIVEEHRVTIAGTVPLVGALLLIASAEGRLPSALTFHPLLLVGGVLVMRSPLLVGLLPALTHRAIAGVGCLSVFVYAIEIVAVRTGWPYGEFAYGIRLGPMFLDVPLALPLLFIPLAANAYLLAMLILPLGMTGRIGGGIALLLVMDLVLDPAAVALGFWAYPAGGAFYGVPVSNFLGWTLSGFVAVTLLDWSLDTGAVRARLDRCRYLLDDFVSFLVLWGIVNAWYGHWIPTIVVLACAGMLLLADPHRWRKKTSLPASIRDGP